jgi:hypothetical protein
MFQVITQPVNKSEKLSGKTRATAFNIVINRNTIKGLNNGQIAITERTYHHSIQLQEAESLAAIQTKMLGLNA